MKTWLKRGGIGILLGLAIEALISLMLAGRAEFHLLFSWGRGLFFGLAGGFISIIRIFWLKVVLFVLLILFFLAIHLISILPV